MTDTTTAGKVHYLSDAPGKLFFCSGPGGAGVVFAGHTRAG